MARVLCSLILVVMLSACAKTPVANGQTAGYVLAGQNVAGGFAQNALVIFDTQTLQVQRRVELPRSWAQNLATDPQGNLWIGFSGDMRDSDNRVQVYSAQGELRKTLRPCTDPEAGISFAAGRAFIACTENGLEGKVVVVNLDTLEIIKELTLSVPDAPLLLISSAAGEQAVVVAGLTTGPEETSYSVITLIDPQALTIQTQVPLGKNTDVWRILPHEGRFYLLNVASYRQPREQANDVLVLTPGSSPTIEPLALAPSPLWGAFDGDVLYAYLNPTWNSTITDPHRQIAKFDLTSGQVQTWQLPDEWNASDLAILNGQIILVKWEYWSGDEQDGLYQFDPVTGQLSLILNVADASQIFFPTHLD